MANILLTQSCVRSCPYCFARKHMEDSAPRDILQWKDLLYIADLLEVAHERNAALLGGEPTLHPEFTDFVLYLVHRGFHVTVFTSGLMSAPRLEEAVRFLRTLPMDQLTFVVNVNDPGICTKAENAKRDQFLSAFGPYCSLGFNIYRVDFDLAFLLDLVNTHGTQRHLRLGLAHPIPGMDTAHIVPDQLHRALTRLMEFVPLIRRLRCTIGFDCGLPLCLFTEAQLGALYAVTQGSVRCGCGPAIDIGPDMTVWSCFPLSGFHRRSLFDFDSLEQVRAFYEGLHRQVREEAGGLFDACDTCEHRDSGLCRGGCLAHLLARFGTEAPVRAPVVYT